MKLVVNSVMGTMIGNEGGVSIISTMQLAGDDISLLSSVLYSKVLQVEGRSVFPEEDLQDEKGVLSLVSESYWPPSPFHFSSPAPSFPFISAP